MSEAAFVEEAMKRELMRAVEKREREMFGPITFAPPNPENADILRNMERMMRALSLGLHVQDLDRHDALMELVELAEVCCGDAGFAVGDARLVYYDAPASYPHSGFAMLYYRGE